MLNYQQAGIEILVVTMSLQEHVFLSLTDLVVKEYCTKGLGYLISQRLCRIFNILSLLSHLRRLDFLVYVEYHTFITVWISW